MTLPQSFEEAKGTPFLKNHFAHSKGVQKNYLKEKNKQPKYIERTNVDKKDSNGLTLLVEQGRSGNGRGPGSM